MAIGQKKTNTVIFPPIGDWEPAPALPFRAAPGVVAVAMDARPDERRGILLPGVVKGHMMPNSGTVVAVGCDVDKKRGPCPKVKIEVSVGERVICLPFEGLRYRRLMMGKFDRKDVRFYGIVGANGRIEFEPYWRSVLMVIEGPRIKRMLGHWVVIKQDPPVTDSGIIFTDPDKRGLSEGKWKATIVEDSAESRENGYCKGDRVIFHAPSAKLLPEFLGEQYEGLDGDPDDYAIVPYTCLYGAILEGE